MEIKDLLGKIGKHKSQTPYCNRIWTIHRCNQNHQPANNLKRLISRIRQRIVRGASRASSKGFFTKFKIRVVIPNDCLIKLLLVLPLIWLPKSLLILCDFFSVVSLELMFKPSNLQLPTKI